MAKYAIICGRNKLKIGQKRTFDNYLLSPLLGAGVAVFPCEGPLDEVFQIRSEQKKSPDLVIFPYPNQPSLEMAAKLGSEGWHVLIITYANLAIKICQLPSFGCILVDEEPDGTVMSGFYCLRQPGDVKTQLRKFL